MEEVQYIFRKAAWRKVVPFLLLLIVAGAGYLAYKGPEIFPEGVPRVMARSTFGWLGKYGVGRQEILNWTTGIGILVFLWFYYGWERLIVTPEAMIRRLPLGLRRTLRWDSVDEVLIEHIERRMEGRSTAKKILTLYARPRRWVPFRRRMRITNREFEGYHQVEVLATQVSIPSIANRMREEIERGQAAKFPMRETGDALLSLFFILAAIAIMAAWGLNAVWQERYLFIRPYVPIAAGLLLLIALKKFFFRQIAVDRKNLCIMRRSFITRKIPLDSIVDVRVLDNKMRVIAKVGKAEKEKQVFKSARFIRNRGVLLRLIRELHDERSLEDATPIQPMPAVRVIDTALSKNKSNQADHAEHSTVNTA